MGKFPDSEIASRFGRGVDGVRARRRELGILSPHAAVAWRPEEIAPLRTLSKTMPPAKAAQCLNRNRKAIYNKRHQLRVLEKQTIQQQGAPARPAEAHKPG